MGRCVLLGIIPLFCFALFPLACAHKPPIADLSGKETNEARLLFQKAESAQKGGGGDRGLSQYRKIRSRFPGTRYARLSAYRLGSAAYARKDYSGAAVLFEEMLKPAAGGTPGNGADEGIDEFKLDATYNLAACEYQQRHFEKVYQVLVGVDPAPIGLKDTRRAEMVYALIERTARALGDRPGLVLALSGHADLPLPAAAQETLNQELDRELTAITDADILISMLNGKPFGRARPIAIVQNPLSRIKIQNRLLALTGQSVTDVDPALTQDSMPIESPSAELPRVVRAGSGSVGILLPLSGKIGGLGKRLLDTLLLSSGLFESNGGSSLRLFIEDTLSSDIEAEAAVIRLVDRQNVSVIIGPLGWKEAVSVAKKSQELDVVNLSLATREGISEHGALIFQNAVTPRVQSESLAEYCVEQRGFKRFAILASSDAFGTEMAYQFWDAVERHGGEVVSLEHYAPEDTDFQAPIQKMVGLFDGAKFRKTELDKVAEFQKELKLKSPRAKERKFRLQPIIDFDAIFIPDVPKVVSQIVSTLAYFDVQGPALLGTADWGVGQIYRRIGKPAVGAFFPVALHPESRLPTQFAFLNHYRDSMGSTPDLLAAQAFEAMDIVSRGLQKAGGSSSTSLAAAIAELQGVEGALGMFGFDAKRIAARRLPVFSVDQAGALIEVSKSVN